MVSFYPSLPSGSSNIEEINLKLTNLKKLGDYNHPIVEYAPFNVKKSIILLSANYDGSQLYNEVLDTISKLRAYSKDHDILSDTIEKVEEAMKGIEFFYSITKEADKREVNLSCHALKQCKLELELDQIRKNPSSNIKIKEIPPENDSKKLLDEMFNKRNFIINELSNRLETYFTEEEFNSIDFFMGIDDHPIVNELYDFLAFCIEERNKNFQVLNQSGNLISENSRIALIQKLEPIINKITLDVHLNEIEKNNLLNIFKLYAMTSSSLDTFFPLSHFLEKLPSNLGRPDLNSKNISKLKNKFETPLSQKEVEYKSFHLAPQIQWRTRWADIESTDNIFIKGHWVNDFILPDNQVKQISIPLDLSTLKSLTNEQVHKIFNFIEVLNNHLPNIEDDLLTYKTNQIFESMLTELAILSDLKNTSAADELGSHFLEVVDFAVETQDMASGSQNDQILYKYVEFQEIPDLTSFQQKEISAIALNFLYELHKNIQQLLIVNLLP